MWVPDMMSCLPTQAKIPVRGMLKAPEGCGSQDKRMYISTAEMESEMQQYHIAAAEENLECAVSKQRRSVVVAPD